jgi:hypothetical protein
MATGNYFLILVYKTLYICSTLKTLINYQYFQLPLIFKTSIYTLQNKFSRLLTAAELFTGNLNNFREFLIGRCLLDELR